MNLNRIATLLVASCSLLAVACGAADDGETKTAEDKGELKGGGSTSAPDGPGTVSPGGPGGGSGGSGSGSAGGGTRTGGDGTVTSPPTEPPSGGGGFTLCAHSECPQQIPAIAALCPDGSVAGLECFSRTKANEPKKCRWEPVCGL